MSRMGSEEVRLQELRGGNEDIRCIYCGEVTGVLCEVCQDCAELPEVKEAQATLESSEPVTNDMPF